MNWVKKHKVLTVVLAIVALVIIAAAAGGSNTTTKKTVKTTPTTTQTSKPKQPAWDAQAIYDQLNAGMTKAQAEQIIGKTSTDCSKTSIEGYGETEYCNYNGGFGSKGTISVTYHDGVVQTKSKIDF